MSRRPQALSEFLTATEVKEQVGVARMWQESKEETATKTNAQVFLNWKAWVNLIVLIVLAIKLCKILF